MTRPNQILASVVLLCVVVLLGVGGWWLWSLNTTWKSFSLADSSVVGVAQIPVPPAAPSPTPIQSVRLLFGGDLMFDRHIRGWIEREGAAYVLAPLEPTFQKYDAVIANLEGPVTTFPSRSVGSAVGSTNNFIFTFSPNIVPMLKKNKFEMVSLGNNHITNFGQEGVIQTKKFLSEGGIGYFGNTGYEATPEERTLYSDIGGYQIAFIGLNQFVADGFAEGLADVKAAKQSQAADLIIVMPHWGNEYWPESGPVIENQAHQLIEAGADLIIGAHPHVTQQVEEYQGKRIYYSLGNFVFDQYFQPEVMAGLLVGVTISTDENGEILLNFEELPIRIDKNGQTYLR
jgi:gamma-polyglutamate biosynthesis protein CapA